MCVRGVGGAVPSSLTRLFWTWAVLFGWVFTTVSFLRANLIIWRGPREHDVNAIPLIFLVYPKPRWLIPPPQIRFCHQNPLSHDRSLAILIFVTPLFCWLFSVLFWVGFSVFCFQELFARQSAVSLWRAQLQVRGTGSSATGWWCRRQARHSRLTPHQQKLLARKLRVLHKVAGYEACRCLSPLPLHILLQVTSFWSHRQVARARSCRRPCPSRGRHRPPSRGPHHHRPYLQHRHLFQVICARHLEGSVLGPPLPQI